MKLQIDKEMTNKGLGTKFESDFATMLFNKDFWVHLLQQNKAGQPADIIAVKDGTAYLIDCKVCTDNHFKLSRIEYNQHLSMDLWRDRGNGEPWFALRVIFDNSNPNIPIYKVYMIPHTAMKLLANSQSSLSYEDILEYGTEFGEWVLKC